MGICPIDGKRCCDGVCYGDGCVKAAGASLQPVLSSDDDDEQVRRRMFDSVGQVDTANEKRVIAAQIIHDLWEAKNESQLLLLEWQIAGSLKDLAIQKQEAART